MKKIVLSHNMPLERFEERLADIEVICPKEPLGVFTEEEARIAIKDADAFMCIADFPCRKDMIDLGENLKVIGNLGSGLDNIDVGYASEKNIFVVNAPTTVTEPTAEMTIALMLSICRSTVRYDRELRIEKKCKPTLLFERDMVISGRTLGIIGFGRIGRSVAKKAVGLGMDIIYYDLNKMSKEDEKKLNARYMEVDDLIRNSDVISLHMPYTKEHHHFMNSERISLMKDTAYLINASRGPIVEEKALVHALKNKIIRGAALDVHEFEPNISQEIIDLPNIVITPHCCTNIADVRMQMLGEAMGGILDILNNKYPDNIANNEVIKKRKMEEL
ncbi:MAG: hypothetical protein GX366_06645 [Epulopiscium sp.]|nr:hypothetical protein [Candidatus Epulonipiscium sp.]